MFIIINIILLAARCLLIRVLLFGRIVMIRVFIAYSISLLFGYQLYYYIMKSIIKLVQ
jgi:hypothetical protein